MVLHSVDELRQLADEYVMDCFRHETPPHVNELARNLGLAAPDFSNLFVMLLGERPSVYFKRCRIESAKDLLAATDLPMNTIAYRCGFGTRRTFFRTFKRFVGSTPDVYRRSHVRTCSG